MVHLDRIREEIRVINIKHESLVSYRIFVNFNRRLDWLNGIRRGMLPDRNYLTQDEITEKGLLDLYFATIATNFPELALRWTNRYKSQEMM
jgi:hypothetical protein